MGGEHPEWLPEGWRVSVKIRSFGRKDKYYIHPSNGLTFNSKPEVLRYLKSSGNSGKPKEPNEIDIKRAVAEKLPSGWIKEIRTKKRGGKTRRDPYYIDPVSGRHFRSMQEVFRYLKSNDSGEAKFKPDDKSVELGDHSQSSSAEAKGPRLIDKKGDKNLTARESVKSGMDLASVVNVKMSEDNHLEQREDDSLAIELSDKRQLVNRRKQHADQMMKIKKLADDKVEKSANVDQRSKSGPNVAAPKNIERPVAEQNDREDDSTVVNLPKKLPQVNGEERQNGGRRPSGRLEDSKLKDNARKDQLLQSGLEAFDEQNINITENNGFEQREKESSCTGEGQQQQNQARQNKRKNANSKWTSDLPRRTSKRLARSEVDPSIEVNRSNKAEASARLSGDGEVDTIKNVCKSGPSDEPEIYTTGKSGRFNDSNDHPSKCRREYPNNNQQKKPITSENLSPPEELKGVGVDCNKDQKDEKNLDSSLKDLLMDPCIEFAIKTLTGAIPIEDVNKVGDSPVSSLASPNQTSTSSSALPSSDIWSDPCFEFAVKTLTGEMPTNNDSQLQISFQQPLSSSGISACNNLTSPKFRLDGIYPSNYSFSQFDAVKNPCMRIQGVRDPPFPHAINGSSQNPVNTSLHRGFEGRTGKFV